MPIYSYECESCGKVHEVFETIEEKGRFLSFKCTACDGKLFAKIEAPHINVHGIYNAKKKMNSDFIERMTTIKKEHPEGFKNDQFF